MACLEIKGGRRLSRRPTHRAAPSTHRTPRTPQDPKGGAGATPRHTAPRRWWRGLRAAGGLPEGPPPPKTSGPRALTRAQPAPPEIQAGVRSGPSPTAPESLTGASCEAAGEGAPVQREPPALPASPGEVYSSGPSVRVGQVLRVDPRRFSRLFLSSNFSARGPVPHPAPWSLRSLCAHWALHVRGGGGLTRHSLTPASASPAPSRGLAPCDSGLLPDSAGPACACASPHSRSVTSKVTSTCTRSRGLLNTR